MDKAKHIHHYVPRRYLRAWSRKGDGVIAVKFGNRAVRQMSVDGVAFEDGGYSYETLTPEMLRSILCCQPRSKLVTDSMMRGFFLPTVVVPVFSRMLDDPSNNNLIAMWRMILDSNLIDEDGWRELDVLRQVHELDREQYSAAMRDHQKEGYEGMLCNIENKAWPVLDSMIKGKLGWLLKDKLAFRMFFYIFSQRTRSPSFKKEALHFEGSMNLSADFVSGALYRRHIIALDSTAILMSIRHKLAFRILKAGAGVEFITGDLPVVTIGDADESKDYYFPLSPNRGFIFGPRANFDHRNAEVLRGDIASARILNRAIVRDSAFQVYGTSEEILNTL